LAVATAEGAGAMPCGVFRSKRLVRFGLSGIGAFALALGAFGSVSAQRAGRSIPDACRPGRLIEGVVDCQGAVVGTSCDGQSESQEPVFTLAEGAVIKNVTLSPDAADGIHCLGNCVLENVVWQDVCEDAATMRGGPGTTMYVIGGSAANAADKVFQHNGVGSTIEIVDFETTGPIGKLYRSCGDCRNNGGPRRVNIRNVKIERVTSSVAGVNANFGDVATIRDLEIRNYEPGKPRVCEEFVGVQKGQGSSRKIGEAFESRACDVRRSDVSGF